MPGTIVPAQMFDHMLDPKKGWPSPYALDKAALPDTGVTGILAGTGVSLNPANGNLVLGLSTAGAMAMWAFQGQNEFDVNGDVGNIIGGHVNCLVAVGAYELETTEFIGVSFAPQATLTLDAATGKVKAAAGGILGTVDIVGIVSAVGPLTNAYGKSTVRFWPVYEPHRG